MDTLSKERRSALMKRVRQANTKPELEIRTGLHRRGLRYNISDKRLPGSPDLSFPRYMVAVFVHGCFWHGHHCRQGRLPTSNVRYWSAKMQANRDRDARKERSLRKLGWRVYTVWECQTKDPGRRERLLDQLAAGIRGNSDSPFTAR